MGSAALYVKLSTNMVGGKQIILIFFFLQPLLSQEDCDPVFGDCGEPEECDDVFGDGECGDYPAEPVEPCDAVFDDCPGGEPVECLSVNEIDDTVFNRQAFKVCEPEPCSDFSDLGYVCAPVWTCRNNTVITDGKGLIDVRTSLDRDDRQCGVVSGTLDLSDKKCSDAGRDHVCCKKPDFRIKKCNDIDRTPPVDNEDFSQCGRNASGVLRFTGTDKSFTAAQYEAQPGEFPHMCVIFRIIGRQKTYVGGATLIAPNKVLTVAHKFYRTNGGEYDIRDKLSEIQIRCGEHNVKEDNSAFPHQDSMVKELIIHPEYSPQRIFNNLAILVTESNFVYQKHIGPVCLPKPNENFEGQPEGSCWSSGWGADKEGIEGYYSDSLKKIDMPIVPQDECKDIFRRNDLRLRTRIHPSWLCVGGVPEKDTCKGDGGSPHVCINEKLQYVMVGAVSHGVGCGTEIPASYSNVAGAMCWIDWVMSTVPMSKYDVDNEETPEDTLGLRQSGNDYQSINGLTENDCGGFKQNNPDLFRQSFVVYETIDTRGTD